MKTYSVLQVGLDHQSSAVMLMGLEEIKNNIK